MSVIICRKVPTLYLNSNDILQSLNYCSKVEVSTILISLNQDAQNGRCGGLMASALVSKSSGPGLSPGQGHCGCVLGQDTS